MIYNQLFVKVLTMDVERVQSEDLESGMVKMRLHVLHLPQTYGMIEDLKRTTSFQLIKSTLKKIEQPQFHRANSTSATLQTD